VPPESSFKDKREYRCSKSQDDPQFRGGFASWVRMMTQLVYNRFRLNCPMKRAEARKVPLIPFEPMTDWNEPWKPFKKSLRTSGCWGSAGDREQALAGCHGGQVLSCRALFQASAAQTMADVGPVCNDAGANAMDVWAREFHHYGKDGATGKKEARSSSCFWELISRNPATGDFAYLPRRVAPVD